MALGWLYGKITDSRNASFDNGRRAAADLGVRTISVGNIATGGTGKTPLVILISEMLASRGKRVCVLTRGYGRKNARSRVIVSDGRRLLSDAANAGDEPTEIAIRLMGKAVVISDPDRASAGEFAREHYGVTTFVLDDGFQHRQVRRDLDIVCIDATNPFAGGRLLPLGRLREPLHNLERADAIVITRADMSNRIDDLRAEIRRHAGDIPVFTARSKMSRMTALEKRLAGTGGSASANGNDLASLAHAKAFAFCAIGNPDSFFRQLERDNFEIAGTRSFRDHHAYEQKDLDFVVKEAEKRGAGYLLTTPKDAVKLGAVRLAIPCFVIESSLVLDDIRQFGSLL